ncbi:MAG: hypothetical protein RSF39_02710 [Romboutsia sp.]
MYQIMLTKTNYYNNILNKVRNYNDKIFISGVAFIILTVIGLREVIVNLIPKNVEYAIGVEVGVLLTIIGLLVVVVGLTAIKVKGSILIAIILTTIIGILMGITQVPESFVTMPPSISPIDFKLDIMGALK